MIYASAPTVELNPTRVGLPGSMKWKTATKEGLRVKW